MKNSEAARLVVVLIVFRVQVLDKDRVGASRPEKAANSNFLHPIFQFYDDTIGLPWPPLVSEQHLLEEVSNTWFNIDSHVKPLLQWVRAHFQVGVQYFADWEKAKKIVMNDL